MDWSDKTVLITGGTGSMGSAFAKYLIQYQPKKLIIFSRGWLAQKSMQDELGDLPFVRYFIGDVRDKDRLMRAFKDVDIVIHAAALKDLPTCEYNPGEALFTNVIGTQNVIDACIDCGVSKSLFISTDKSVAPCNTYGATKALAERLWLNANKIAADDNIRFSVCRYGNVWNSSGSVLPIWLKMIKQGAEYLPVTDINMSRFIFKMEDVMRFVEDSIKNMQGGELYIPKLPSARIVDICEALNMSYEIIGIRPGEKIHEEMELGYDSGSNPWYLSVDDLRKMIQNVI